MNWKFLLPSPDEDAKCERCGVENIPTVLLDEGTKAIEFCVNCIAKLDEVAAKAANPNIFYVIAPPEICTEVVNVINSHFGTNANVANFDHDVMRKDIEDIMGPVEFSSEGLIVTVKQSTGGSIRLKVELNFG